MSHFTQVETKINDLVALKAALEELGLAFEQATENQLVKVRGWKGSTLTYVPLIPRFKSDQKFSRPFVWMCPFA